MKKKLYIIFLIPLTILAFAAIFLAINSIYDDCLHMQQGINIQGMGVQAYITSMFSVFYIPFYLFYVFKIRKRVFKK